MLTKLPLFYTGIEDDDRKKHLIRLGLASVYFAVTFIFVSYLSHAWSTANAWKVGYAPYFSYDGMENLYSTSGWTLSKVAFVYLAPPLWGLTIGLMGFLGFSFTEGKHIHLRTLFYWLGFNGYLLYYSYIVNGLLSGGDFQSKFHTGFIGFYSWLEWSPTKCLGILAVQAIFSLPVPLVFSKGILQLNHSRELVARTNGKQMAFLHWFAIPAMVGCMLIALTTFPMDLKYQVVRMICIVPLGIMTLLGVSMYIAKHIRIVKGGLKPVGSVAFVMILCMLLLLRIPLSLQLQPLW